jgi:D-beta-D-heptose 7-phosphate kinase / D-beta-D-heptose 1-phosphate adenosyltransferase
VLAAGLGSGAEIGDAVEAANLAAGIVVGKRGTAVVTPAEMLHEIQHRSVISVGDKELRLEELMERASEWDRRGYRIGFTNGCFDLLHPGYISLLESARARCDRLVVGLNSDESAARLKGPGHPVQDEVARALVLASLGCVDAVVLFDEDTPLEIIRRLRPKLLAKGRNYQPHEVVGTDLLPAWNGELLLVDIVPGHSTADTMTRLANAKERSRPQE